MLANKILTDEQHFVSLIDPVADFLVNGSGITCQGINMSDAVCVTFFVWWGVGATGTNTLTVNAATSAANAGGVAIPFRYRTWGTGNSAATDWDMTPGALTYVTAAGILTVAGSHQLYALEVNAQDMSSQGSTFKYAVLVSTPGVASPLLGGAFALVRKGKERAANLDTTLIT